MGFPVDGAGRVSQGQYWAFFGAYMIAVPVLLIGGAVTMFGGSFGLGLLMIAAVIPLGIYWRVIMMRRCRDIGWPPFLPWLIFGLQFAAGFVMPINAASMETPELSLFALPLILGLADFAFSITIGCIGPKQATDYADVFGGDVAPVQRTRPAGAASSGSDGPDRFDDAIARALDAHRRGESVLDSAPVRPALRPAPAMPGRPAGGFGRRVV